MNEFTERDIENLNLLKFQLLALSVSFVTNLSFMNSTLQGLEILSNKYNPNFNKDDYPNPDDAAMFASELAIVASMIISTVAMKRYDSLKTDFDSGTIDYSITPNLIITVINVIGLITSIVAYIQFNNIYVRTHQNAVII